MTSIITEYGAVADGATVNTKAIQDTIDACAESGGGTVVIPPGCFVSGTLRLRSHIVLHLEPGAVLKGSPRLEDYRESGFVHVDNHFSQGEGGHSTSLIYAINAEAVSISGAGTIDLSSEAFFDFSTIKPIPGVDPSTLTPEQRSQAPVVKLEGPTQPVFFSECRRVSVSGVHIINAPSLTININSCRDVKISGITIEDDLRVPISDGIHICGSTDILITDSRFVCGDDCVAITGVTNWNDLSERIVISNCSMCSSSAAVRVGYLAGKIRDVVISNLVIQDTTRGFTLFAGDDGFVENVTVSNVVMHTRILAGDWWGKGEPLVIFAPRSSGRIENIRVSGVTAESENGAVIVGNGENVRNISLSDWDLSLYRGPNFPLLGGRLDLEPVETRRVPVDRAPWLTVTEATDISLARIRYRGPVVDGDELPAEAVVGDGVRITERDVHHA